MPKQILCVLSCLTSLLATCNLLAQGVAAKIETPLLRFVLASDSSCELWDKKAKVALGLRDCILA